MVTNSLNTTELEAQLREKLLHYLSIQFEYEGKILFQLQIIMGMMGFFSLVLLFLIICVFCSRQKEYNPIKNHIPHGIPLEEKKIENSINEYELIEKSKINDLYGF